MRYLTIFSLIMLLLVGCGETTADGGPPTAEATVATATALSPQATPSAVGGPRSAVAYTYRVVNAYPHDTEAFTQGLSYVDGVLYEGTGLNAAFGGQSSLRRVDLETGDVQQMIMLDPEYFGEGIVVWEDRILQLTWQSRIGFIYDRESFEQLDTFSYPTEGWGFTHDGATLIMSDGTDTLYFWDPETLEEIGRIQVRDERGPVVRLNELEYIEGEVWANVWQTDTIVRIDPATGHVVGRIDLAGLLTPQERAGADVLNGIAYDGETGRIFITGKLWPILFEIEVVPVGSL